MCSTYAEGASHLRSYWAHLNAQSMSRSHFTNDGLIKGNVLYQSSFNQTLGFRTEDQLVKTVTGVALYALQQRSIIHWRPWLRWWRASPLAAHLGLLCGIVLSDTAGKISLKCIKSRGAHNATNTHCLNWQLKLGCDGGYVESSGGSKDLFCRLEDSRQPDKRKRRDGVLAPCGWWAVLNVVVFLWLWSEEVVQVNRALLDLGWNFD